ncbi:MAG: polyprenyl synthetase family protein [Bacteroidales bacterium]
MLTIGEIQEIVSKKLEKESFISEPASLYEPIDYIMSIGGKRLRPMLVIIAAQLYGKPVESVIDAAVGVEVFHNFTLVHDDIMDQAPIRRGKKTVHKAWDINTAILSGDTMMVLAYDHLLRSHSKNIVQILNTFNQTAREVCEGQQYDMDFEKRSDVSIGEYMEMIRLKTSVLMAAALKIGALYADAPEEDLENLYRFGEKIGLAFQLKDDLLDVFGDESKFGKQTGNDIITNKKTYLLVRCLADASQSDRAALESWLKVNDRPQEKINEVTKLYRKYNIPEKTNLLIEELYSEGVHYLGKVTVEVALKKPLHDFAEALRLRDS